VGVGGIRKMIVRHHSLSTQNEKFVQESEQWQLRVADCKAAVQEEAKKGRSQKEAFQRKIADLERGNNQLQQESFTKSDDV